MSGAAPRDAGPLSLRLELASAWPPAGTALLLNAGAAEVNVFAPGNSWGDELLSFQVAAGEQVHRIHRLPQVYTRNFPAVAAIRPGETYGIAFDLGDGTWEPAPRGETLTAVFAIEPSPEADTLKVWIGRVQSPPVSLG